MLSNPSPESSAGKYFSARKRTPSRSRIVWVGFLGRVGAFECALDIAGHRGKLRRGRPGGAGRRHIARAKTLQDLFPRVAAAQERLRGSELRDVHPARGELRVVAGGARPRENRPHGIVEPVSLSADTCGLREDKANCEDDTECQRPLELNTRSVVHTSRF
jgi:hypothetical protein